MKNILLFPCGSGVALEFYEAVKHSRHFNLIGASSIHDHGEFVFENYIGDVPYYDSVDFIPRIKDIVVSRHIDAIYPAMDGVMPILKKNEAFLGCKVLCSDIETVDLCLSKHSTYKRLKSVMRVPVEYSIDDQKDYPLFLKPDVGYGSKGTRKVWNEIELRKYINDYPNYLILEYLTGDEFTIDCFTDRHGDLLFAKARSRNRVKDGISVNTSFANHQDVFFEIAKRINDNISLRGAWFAQVKYSSEGELCLMEVASRLGGSSGLCRSIGVNLALLTLFDAFDTDVSIDPNDYDTVMDRYWGCMFNMNIDYDVVYVCYDYCIIDKNGNINSNIVKYLYECINKNKRIVLLTKHDGDLDKDLRDHRLSMIFDKIIRINKNDDKVNYIDKNCKSIYIDSSFKEMKKAKTELGIPVFAPDMIDCLL